MIYQEKYIAPEEDQNTEEQSQLENYANERTSLKASIDDPISTKEVVEEKLASTIATIGSIETDNNKPEQNLLKTTLVQNLNQSTELVDYIQEFKQQNGVQGRGQIQENLRRIGFGGDAYDFDKINNAVTLRDGTRFNPFESTSFSNIHNTLNNYKQNHITHIESNINQITLQLQTTNQEAEQKRRRLLREKGVEKANRYVDKIRKQTTGPMNEQIGKLQTTLDANKEFFQQVATKVRNVRNFGFKNSGFASSGIDSADAIFLNKCGYIIQQDFLDS